MRRRPVAFLRRMAALVPPPRANLVRYFGVFAPNARGRPRVVPASLPRRCPRQLPAPWHPPPSASASHPLGRAPQAEVPDRRPHLPSLWGHAARRGRRASLLHRPGHPQAPPPPLPTAPPGSARGRRFTPSVPSPRPDAPAPRVSTLTETTPFPKTQVVLPWTSTTHRSSPRRAASSRRPFGILLPHGHPHAGAIHYCPSDLRRRPFHRRVERSQSGGEHAAFARGVELDPDRVAHRTALTLPSATSRYTVARETFSTAAACATVRNSPPTSPGTHPLWLARTCGPWPAACRAGAVRDLVHGVFFGPFATPRSSESDGLASVGTLRTTGFCSPEPKATGSNPVSRALKAAGVAEEILDGSGVFSAIGWMCRAEG